MREPASSLIGLDDSSRFSVVSGAGMTVAGRHHGYYAGISRFSRLIGLNGKAPTQIGIDVLLQITTDANRRDFRCSTYELVDVRCVPIE